jgi:hypothetical protein
VLRFEDCLELYALSEEEIRAIAEHEHIRRSSPWSPATI